MLQIQQHEDFDEHVMREYQQQIEKLKNDAVTELRQKIVEARKVVTDLEAELEELTGKSVASGAKATRVRRPSITDDPTL